ncbi:MAG TPA: ISKra4 family transposase, partial [Acidiferrobacterales bacterium]|nr:ISKra4 family transposase [Acidiferrobacterales bacterium]
QVASWLSANSHCPRCGSALSHKDSQSIVVRTVFGKMALTSPRRLSCACETAPGAARRSTSPLCKALAKRVTPELEYLQVKWAAHLPFRQAAALLKEVLPLDKGISFSGTRDRTHAVGKALDAEIEREIALQPPASASESPRQADNVSCVSVDSAWLRCCEKSETQARQVNIVAGRATFDKRAPRVYAYVRKQVASAAARLDQFLPCNGVTPEERVSVISDDAGEFSKAVEGSQLARGRILDWFHIAMKFKAAENAVFGCKQIESLERETVKAEIRSAKWLVWHGKGAKAIARIKALDASLLPRQGYEYSTLWWNLHGITCYLRNNTPVLVNYGARYRKGLPISSSIAESAVNQVVSLRMAKKRQMRWTDAGAHHLTQVRVAVLYGELSPSRLASLGKTSSPRSAAKRPNHTAQALAP